MQDEELVSLCKRIYRHHREAIDLIVEYGAASQIVDACEQSVRSLIDVEYVKAYSNSTWFLPRDMADVMPEVELRAWTHLPKKYPMVIWFQFRKDSGRLNLIAEVGPISDAKLRQNFLRALGKSGFTFQEKTAMREEAKFTRIYSKAHTLRVVENDGAVDDNPEYIREVVEQMWKKFWVEGKKIVTVAKKFDWDGGR